MATGPSTELGQCPSTAEPLPVPLPAATHLPALGGSPAASAHRQQLVLPPHLLVTQSFVGASRPQGLGIPTSLSEGVTLHLVPW